MPLLYIFQYDTVTFPLFFLTQIAMVDSYCIFSLVYSLQIILHIETSTFSEIRIFSPFQFLRAAEINYHKLGALKQ